MAPESRSPKPAEEADIFYPSTSANADMEGIRVAVETHHAVRWIEAATIFRVDTAPFKPVRFYVTAAAPKHPEVLFP